MEKDKRTGWLKELKVGDEVFVKHIGDNDNYNGMKFGVVFRITPTGKIVVFRRDLSGRVNFNDKIRYSAEGYNGSGLFPTQLVEVKPEIKKIISEYFIKDITTTINYTTLNSLNLNSLENLVNYLKIFKKATKIEDTKKEEENIKDVVMATLPNDELNRLVKIELTVQTIIERGLIDEEQFSKIMNEED